ncbi:hypothetical protein G6F53_013984 [Rhizopus delemar]|nr:hypothetical protein G6F53_013984 [Rhizopus delemar]
MDLQHHGHDPRRRAGRQRPGLAAGRPGAADAGRWSPAIRAGRLVPAFRWLLRVLPVAPPRHRGDAHGA